MVDFHTENAPQRRAHTPTRPLRQWQATDEATRKRAHATRNRERRTKSQPPSTHDNLPTQQVTAPTRRTGHTARFGRGHRASQRTPTMNAHRHTLTQAAPDRLPAARSTTGARDNTDHRQPRQLYPFRPLWFLFKVLCNFPSRYLFAIGLVAVFSLRCGIPPTLSCIPKQLDSKTHPTTAIAVRTGLTPSLEDAFQRTSDSSHDSQTRLYATPRRRQQTGRLCAGLFRFHSPLLTESLLVSFPPLTDMLKFSG